MSRPGSRPGGMCSGCGGQAAAPPKRHGCPRGCDAVRCLGRAIRNKRGGPAADCDPSSPAGPSSRHEPACCVRVSLTRFLDRASRTWTWYHAPKPSSPGAGMRTLPSNDAQQSPIRAFMLPDGIGYSEHMQPPYISPCSSAAFGAAIKPQHAREADSLSLLPVSN